MRNVLGEHVFGEQRRTSAAHKVMESARHLGLAEACLCVVRLEELGLEVDELRR